MADTIVPFGKYRGQPVDVLQQDPSYCEWLAAQEWFRTRFASIHTLIVNNFPEAHETPEHNALQVMFTDAAFVQAFACSYLHAVPWWTERLTTEPHIEIEGVWFEVEGVDVCVMGLASILKPDAPEGIGCRRFRARIECKPSLGDDYPAVLRQMKAQRSTVLLIGTGGYRGTGATLEQVKQMFGASDIIVMQLSDIKQEQP